MVPIVAEWRCGNAQAAAERGMETPSVAVHQKIEYKFKFKKCFTLRIIKQVSSNWCGECRWTAKT